LILTAAVMMQLCLGATYSWSVFVGPLRTTTGLGQGLVQFPFSIFYVVFPATMLFSGLLMVRFGPRFCAGIGTVLFGGGWIIASLGSEHFLLTVAGIGILGGVGVGLAYLVPVAVGVHWFPRHKGLVTGITLAGFGGGAALISQIAGRLMNDYAYTPFDIFGLLGAVYIVLAGLGSLNMRFALPTAGHIHKPQALTIREVAGRSTFWFLYLTMFAGLIAGFTVNANMTRLYNGSEVKAGVLAVSFFAIANALGRIVWGFFFDRVQTTTAIKFNLILQALLMLSCYWTLRCPLGLYLFALIAGLNYGGLLVIHASASARYWGGQNVGQVFGWLSSSNIPAALAPVLTGLTYDRLGYFTIPLVAIGVLLALVAIFAHRFMSDRPIISTG